MIRHDNQKAREYILKLQCNFGDQVHVKLCDWLIVVINIPNV